MKYYSRRWVKPGDLNPAQRLFGGTTMAWIDEEAAIFASCQMGTDNIVTKYVSEIDFVSSARSGDMVEFGMEVVRFGNSSLTMRCELRNKKSREIIAQVDKIVFVALDEDGMPTRYPRDPITSDFPMNSKVTELPKISIPVS